MSAGYLRIGNSSSENDVIIHLMINVSLSVIATNGLFLAEIGGRSNAPIMHRLASAAFCQVNPGLPKSL